MQPILKRFISLLIITAVAYNAAAQTAGFGVGVTLSITPPYSPRLTDYAEQPGKTILLLKNNAGRVMNVYLSAKITGDNGIIINTKPGYKPAQPIVLQSGQLLQADINMLRDIFDDSKLAYSKITAADIVKKNGIPEGNYQICIAVLDFNTNAQVSDPATGCRLIRIASLEPPSLIKPHDNEQVKSFDLQHMMFSWTVPAGAEPGTKYKFRMVELPDMKKNPNDVYRNGPAFYEAEVNANVLVYSNGQPALVKGRKYAWAVTALSGPKGTAYKNHGLSEVHSFEYGDPLDIPGLIKLIYPEDNATVTPNPDPAKNFLSWDYPATLVSNLEMATIVVMKPNQKKEDAIAGNENIGGKESYKKSFLDFSKYEGKTIAWQVKVTVNGKVYMSNIRTFTIMKAEAITIAELKSFDLCGFPVSVTNLHQVGPFTFSGSGKSFLYKGGKAIDIEFDHLSIQPFGKEEKKIQKGEKIEKQKTTEEAAYNRWTATSGKSVYAIGHTNMPLSMPKDIAGSAWLTVGTIEFIPAVISNWDPAKGYFTETADYSKANYVGKFGWQSGIMAKTKNGKDAYASYYSVAEEKVEADFVKKIVHAGSSKLSYSGQNGENTILPSLTKNTTIGLGVTMNYEPTSCKFRFSGSYTVAHPKKPLSINFEDKESLYFDTYLPKGWHIMLNEDGSVMADFDVVRLNLSKNLSGTPQGLSIPDVKITFTQKGKFFNFGFKNAHFYDDLGLTFLGTGNGKEEFKVMGFPAITDKYSINVMGSALFDFTVEGNLVVPVINQKAGFVFYADKKGIQTAEMNFVTGQTTTLYNKPATGDKCTFTASYGTLEFDKMKVGGYFSFSNTTPGKNLNVTEIQSSDFVVQSDGTIYMVGGMGYTVETLTHPTGDFNGFKLTANKFQLSAGNGKGFMTLGGVMALADNLTPGSLNKDNFLTTIAFNVADITTTEGNGNNGKGGPSFLNAEENPEVYNEELSFSTSATAGGNNESSEFTGANLKYYDGDATYGTGFKAEVKYAMKSPADQSKKSDKSINATLWIGHMSQGYNYWFLEAGQKNVVVIPTGVLDLTISGFKGRVFYHMKHEGESINGTNYIPDADKFIGVYGQVNLKTGTDDGVKFWGDLAFEMQTNSSGPEYIRLLGNGNFISAGEGSDGILQATDCLLAIESSPEARVHGDFTGKVNAAGILTVKAHAGFDISKSVFHIWGSGSGSFMGKEAPVSCGFDLDQNRVMVGGTYKIVDINWHNTGVFCDDDVLVQASIGMNASINYWPFQFNGDASFNGVASLTECGVNILNIDFSLNGQVQFPSPACISMGISIGGFDFDAGFKDGKFMFDKCF